MQKYHNEPVETSAGRFGSKAEYRRYTALVLRARAGEIENLRCQVRYPLVVNGSKVATYVADFVYSDWSSGQEVETVEDVKGVATAVFRLKAKLFAALYGKEITVVPAHET